MRNNNFRQKYRLFFCLLVLSISDKPEILLIILPAAIIHLGLMSHFAGLFEFFHIFAII